MRTDLIVRLHERVEDPLLQIRIRRGRLGGLGFEYPMHALVRAVLWRTRGRNPLMHDAELQPPGVEAIQPVNPMRSEGRAMVTADRVRKSVAAKQLPQLSVHALCFHVGKLWQHST